MVYETLGAGEVLMALAAHHLFQVRGFLSPQIIMGLRITFVIKQSALPVDASQARCMRCYCPNRFTAVNKQLADVRKQAKGAVERIGVALRCLLKLTGLDSNAFLLDDGVCHDQVI